MMLNFQYLGNIWRIGEIKTLLFINYGAYPPPLNMLGAVLDNSSWLPTWQCGKAASFNRMLRDWHDSLIYC